MDDFVGGQSTCLIDLFENNVEKYPQHPALICNDLVVSYQSLASQANQLAHYLISQGVCAQKGVALFLDRSLESYIALLAVLKTGAFYVPIDTEYPDERVNHILSDMPFQALITHSWHTTRSLNASCPVLILDKVYDTISTQPITRPVLPALPDEALCYVIYTSGSTGKPKGVAVTHRSICHYVQVASTLYEMHNCDRVYQGFSLAFDASLEEIWMAFANGATLIACISKEVRSGLGLIDFLRHHQVSVFSTIPTLLSTLEGVAEDLRLCILGGEACSLPLLKRWQRPGLRILNTYGPTETTVIATYADCSHIQNTPVPIGKPLPGYEVLILDEYQQPVPHGSHGELCISGVGLAQGYVNRAEMTQEKFRVHPLDAAKRIYCTGDLACINAEGDIEFLGRIDSQVKLRGFRIELNEIEAVIQNYPGISQAVVSLCMLDSSPTLVAYVNVNQPMHFEIAALKTFLQEQLPFYMIPALFERLTVFPLLINGKIDRSSLPVPEKNAKLTNYKAPCDELEKHIAAIWASELNCLRISVDADFFYELGGHSLLAAKTISQLRKLPGLSQVSILDLYNHPSIAQLAEHCRASEQIENAGQKPESTPTEKEKCPVSSWTYGWCAVGQFVGCLFQYAVSAWQLLAIVACSSFMLNAGSSFLEIAGVCIGLFLGLPVASMVLTIAAKWLLLGRVKPGRYKLWGWFYFRWWFVQRLQQNVCCSKHLAGSPLINWYFRLLGARIGKNCYIGTASVAMHDSLTIGDNTSIAYDARLLNYIVEDGWLKIGTLSIGKNCYIGARTLLGINTLIKDNGILDDLSMLPEGMQIDAGQYYFGSPARKGTVPPNHMTQRIKSEDTATGVKNLQYGLLHYGCLLVLMFLNYICYYPALSLMHYLYNTGGYVLTAFPGIPLAACTYLLLYYGMIIGVKKRLLNRMKPGTYPVQSLLYLRQWMVVRMLDSDAVFVMADSLYLPFFMRLLGAKLGRQVEMGEAPHVIPDLVTIGDEGFCASSVAFAWPRIYQGMVCFEAVEVGKRGFLGNVSLLPAGMRIGEGSLLGCMSIPPAGDLAVVHNTAWLGSPPVFLPQRELFPEYSDSDRFTPSKTCYRARLALEFLRIIAPQTFALFGFFNLLCGLDYLLAHYSLFTAALTLPFLEMGIVWGLVAAVVGLKWLILGKLKPDIRPIWDLFIRRLDFIEYSYSYFVNTYFTNLVLGTPFAAILFRCFGATIGKKVFIDTAEFAEFDLITIQDEVSLNAETLIDTHLYEDRIFKMSTIRLEQGCTVGTGSIILYNTVMEKNSNLGNLSLLMKGEILPANTSWHGSPAQPISRVIAAVVLPETTQKREPKDVLAEINA